eukprot:Nk52_evm65s230 gene=Nk52_evmTU65s230
MMIGNSLFHFDRFYLLCTKGSFPQVFKRFYRSSLLIKDSHKQGRSLSHYGNPTLQEVIARSNAVEERLRALGDTENGPLEEKLYYLKLAADSELMRFILVNKGVNGRMTRIFTYHHMCRFAPGLNPYGTPLDPLEELFLEKFRLIQSTAERARIFDREIQKLIEPNKVIGSIPCGVFTDVLTLDYSKVSGYKLIGMDLDPNSLSQARQIAMNLNVSEQTELKEVDILAMDFQDTFDVLVSSGITLYMSNNEDIIQFYSKLYKALKKGGTLVTSFCTVEKEWVLGEEDKEIKRLEIVVLEEILEVAWRNTVSTENLKEQLISGGFERENIDIIPDSRNMFPTVIATK